MLNQKEIKILKEIAERQVVTSTELKRLAKESKSTIETCVRSLIEKKFIATLSFSDKCYVITKTGLRALEDYE